MKILPGKYRSEIEALSHNIWDYAEVEFETEKSSQACIDVLSKHGFIIEKSVANLEHSFVATYGTKGPIIGILVEFDALSGMSQVSGSSEKLVNDSQQNGHACGHNLLGSAGILAALKLKNILLEKNLNATIKVFGCPAEESGYGKAIMADAGIFNTTDCALCWHPNTINGLWSDKTLAVRIYEVTFFGQSAHAAGAPESGFSALDACELLNIGMNYYREHTPDGTRIHYAYIDAGGKAANVVQANATMSYYLRSFSNDTLDIMENRFRKMVEGASLMSGTTYEIKLKSQCKGFNPNTTLSNIMYEVMENYGPLDYSEQAIKDAAKLSVVEGVDINVTLEPKSIGNLSMVSTDVGDVSQVIPTVQFFLACEPMGTPMHSWQWTSNGKSEYAYEGIEHASNILALTALEIIKRPNVLVEATKEIKGN